jgi:hypothetical protein
MQIITGIRIMSFEETGLPMNIPYEEQGNLLKDWCFQNNATYYANIRGKFSLHEAVRLAREGEFGTVVVEDMS